MRNLKPLLRALFIACVALAVNAAIAAPVITTNTLAPGTRFATQLYVQDSGVAGPTVMIEGGAHGNEPAGAAAAEMIRHWPITKGKLVAVPRANVLGLAANKRLIPDLSTNLSNLNRNYPRAGRVEGPRGELAAAIWNAALQYKPDWLLDLHEGYDFNQLNENSVGSSVIVFPDAKGKAAANLMLAAVNAAITNPELKFVRRDMPIDGSLARAGGEHLKVPSMTLETTSKQPMAKRIQQQEIMVHALLHHLGMLNGDSPSDLTTKTASEPADTLIRVAIYKGPGTGGAGPPNLLKKLDHAPESSISVVTPDDIRSGVLTNFDVVIFGGGSGSKQAEALGENGREQVRQFVENGGGYVGICAGAYLATSGYSWSLNLVNARTISPKWQRGKGTVKIELTDQGQTLLGQHRGQFDVHYANGPVVKPAGKDDLPEYEVLGYFRTEMAENSSPAGVMVDSPAIFAGPYKHGRVVCISPHPEQTTGLDDIVPNAVAWVSPKEKATKKVLSKAE